MKPNDHTGPAAESEIGSCVPADQWSSASAHPGDDEWVRLLPFDAVRRGRVPAGGVTPRKTADAPLGIGGRYARVTPRYLAGYGHGHHLLLPHSHLDQRRAQLVRSRRRRPLPSVSLLRPPYFDSSRENLPRHLLHLPQPPTQLLPAGIAPATAGHHWSCLKLCSTVDPPLRSSSAQTVPRNGSPSTCWCFPDYPSPPSRRKRRRVLCPWPPGHCSAAPTLPAIPDPN